MDVNDAMLVVIRWAHVVAGVAWVGGGLFYLLVLQPSLATIDDQSYVESLKRDIAEKFKEVVELSVMALVATGVILSFNRLTQTNIGNLYVILLALKVTAAVGMFSLFWMLRRRKPSVMARPKVPTEDDGPGPQSSVAESLFSPSRLVLVLGLLVFFLADALQAIYENGLRRL